MKAGIWGTGKVADVHAAALRANGIEIGCAVNVHGDKAEKFAAKWGIPRWGDDPALLFERDVDCVHLCTPPTLHFDMLMELFARKKHVLCEKPLCIHNDQAERLVKALRESGVVCGVNFNVRFHEGCIQAKKLTEEGTLGSIRLVHGSYLQEFNTFPAPLDWRYDESLAGKMRAVTEIGSHWADLAQHLTGERITAVSAQFGCFAPRRKLKNGVMTARGEGEDIAVSSEDAACVSLRFENGGIGCVTLSEVSHGRINRLSLEITGDKGSLWWDSENNNALNTSRKGGGIHREVYPFGGGFGDSFSRLMGAFYADVAKGKPSPKPAYPTLSEAAHIVAVCNAIYDSACSDSHWVDVLTI